MSLDDFTITPPKTPPPLPDIPDMSHLPGSPVEMGMRRPNTGLAQKAEAKRLREQQDMMAVLANANTAEASGDITLLIEKRTKGVVPTDIELTPSVSKIGVSWRPVSMEELTSAAAKGPSSNLFIVLHEATTKPGMGFTLKTGLGGEATVRADEKGQFYVAEMGGSTPTPAIQEQAPVKIPPAPVKATPVVQAVQSDVLSQIDESFTRKPEPSVSREPSFTPRNLVGSKISSMRKPVVEVKAPVKEVKEEVVSLKELNKLLFKAQQNYSAKNKILAEELSEIVAEALLTGQKNISKKLYNELLGRLG